MTYHLCSECGSSDLKKMPENDQEICCMQCGYLHDMVENYYLNEHDLDMLANKEPVELLTKQGQTIIIHHIDEKDLSDELIDNAEY